MSQNHYWLIIFGRFLLTSIMIFGTGFEYIGFICWLVPISNIVLVAVRQPYMISYDNYRALVNQSIELAMLIIYTFFGSFVDYEMHD